MKNSKYFPIALTVAIIAGSGMLAATAQDQNADGAQSAQQESHRGKDRDHGHKGGDKWSGKHKRGHHFGKGHGGPGFGGRGDFEVMRTLFRNVDANDDGSLTQDEIDAYRADKVAGADGSGDGALSIEEFDGLYRDLTRPRMVRAFQRLDANGDGIIDASELDDKLAHIVEKLDRNGDGALSRDDRGRR